jgi:hypothetical protein
MRSDSRTFAPVLRWGRPSPPKRSDSHTVAPVLRWGRIHVRSPQSSDEVGFTYGRPSPPMRSDSRTDKQTLKNPSRKIALILVCKGYGTLSYPLHARIHVRMYLPYPFLNDAWYLDCISHSKKGMASTLGFRYGCAKGMTFCHTLSTPESVTFFGGSFWSMLARRWSTEMLLRFQFLKTVHVLRRLS